MKFDSFLGWSSALCLSATLLQAQETNEVGKVDQQIKQLQEKFQAQQRQMQENFERMMREQQAQIEALKKQIATTSTNAPSTNQAAAPSTNAAPTTASAEDVDELRERVDELTKASKRTFISQFNPGIGFVVDSIFGYTSRPQTQTGLDRPGGFDAELRSAELNLEASVDPFARAYGVLNATADARTGEASVGVEEAAIITTSLPWNLTAQGGRFFAEYGRLSYVHDHDLPFVFRPLVLDRYVGGESRTDGLQVNYLFPTEHFFSFTAGIGDGFGADAGPTTSAIGFRGLVGVNYWSRFSTFFDLTPNLNLETGLSVVANPGSQGTLTDPTERDRYVGDLDVTLRYQPLSSTVYRGLVWGTEALFNSANFENDPGIFNRENSTGLYSYLEGKVSREFKVGFLFDWLEEPENRDANIYRYSPYVTWNPSEFQLLRLQYSHTAPNAATGLRSSEGIYLQWSAIIGRHVHGFKQR